MRCGAKVPEYVKSCQSLIALGKSYSSSKLYHDNLCAFLCLAVHCNLRAGKSFHYKLESQTKQFSKELCEGISLVDVPQFENEFSVNVDIYCLSPDHSLIPRYMSKFKCGDKMVLNLTPDRTHLSCINKVDTFLTRLKCVKCSRLFDHMSHLTRHIKVCKKKQAICFSGGSYKLPLNMHKKLVRAGIEVPDGEQIAYKWYATFDCERILDMTIADMTTDDKMEYLNRHIPVSISLVSNVPDFTDPILLCERNPDVLVDKIFRPLREIRDIAACSQHLGQCFQRFGC